MSCHWFVFISDHNILISLLLKREHLKIAPKLGFMVQGLDKWTKVVPSWIWEKHGRSSSPRGVKPKHFHIFVINVICSGWYFHMSMEPIFIILCPNRCFNNGFYSEANNVLQMQYIVPTLKITNNFGWFWKECVWIMSPYMTLIDNVLLK